jgi:hypothetical protein
MTLPTNQEDKLKLLGALKDVSNAMTLIEAQRDVIKEVKNDICEELQIEKKIFNRLARVYHKGNFQEEKYIHEQFEELYTEVVGNVGGDTNDE